MVGAYLYDNDGGKDVAFLNEGNYTVVEGDTSLGTNKVAIFVGKIKLDDEIVPDGLTPDGLIRVKKRAVTDANPIGKITSNPKGTIQLDKDYNWGDYNPRRADVDFYGDKLEMATVVAPADTDLSPYPVTFLKPSGTALNKLVKSDTPTNTVLLGPVTKNTEALVPILKGYRL